jgi:hypothetical protein
VIQEELLKDLANKSDMSDWFNREDAPKTAAPLVTRPNPKNKQNAAKIEELEREIKRCALNRIQGFDLTADHIRAPDCNQSASHLKHSSDDHQYRTVFLNTPTRQLCLLQLIHLFSHLPMLTHSSP